MSIDRLAKCCHVQGYLIFYLLHELHPVSEPEVLAGRQDVPPSNVMQLFIRFLRYHTVVRALCLQSENVYVFTVACETSTFISTL